MARYLKTLLPLPLLLLAVTCTPDFDTISIVKDLRILAIRAEPPEIILSKSPDVWPSVKVDALVVDPTLKKGETVEWEMWGCGISSEQKTCCNINETTCVEDVKKGILKIGSGKGALDSIGASVVLTKEMYRSALYADSQKGLGGVPILVELRVRRQGQPWQVGVKRLVYGVYDTIDLSCLPTLKQEDLDACIQKQRCEQFLYVCKKEGKCTICQGIPEKDLDTGKPKLPNKNPLVHYVKVSEGKKQDESDDMEIPKPTTWSTYGDAASLPNQKAWEVTEGIQHFVLPKPDPLLGAEQEEYVIGARVPSYDEAAGKFAYTFVLKEYLTFHFFATQGEWSNETTGGKPARIFTNKKVTEVSSRWKPPSVEQEDGSTITDATLWVVVHDDRGGVGWMTFKAKINKKKK